jgi:3'(2'), 5'-bisphosphate nucleotidase
MSHPSLNLSGELPAALEAVREACGLCEAVRRDLKAISTRFKADRSPVTVADLGSQALVLSALARSFPGDPVVAEEDGDVFAGTEGAALLKEASRHVQAKRPDWLPEDVSAAIKRGGHRGGPEGRFWTLDPIDGTKGFLRGDQYAIALALIVQGYPRLGILGCPALPLELAGLPGQSGETGAMAWAVLGKGAWCMSLRGGDPIRLQIAGTRDPRLTRFCESFESGHSAHDASARIAEELGTVVPPLRMDSQCKYLAVASGAADLYLRLPTRAGYEENIWDHAAGALIVAEAGGVVRDTLGQALDFGQGRTLSRNRGIIAGCPGIADQVRCG